MDARTPDNMKPMAESDSKAPAFVFRVSAQVGQNKNIELTFGAPMDMTPADLNAYLDKVMSVVDRQNDKGVLEQLKLTLEQAEKTVQTNMDQKAALESKFALEWSVSNRRGEFKPNAGQQAQLNNFDTTAKELRENRIPQLRKMIAELERKIDGA
jgi:hypothetical protein